MKKFCRFLIAILCLVMLLSCVACSSGGSMTEGDAVDAAPGFGSMFNGSSGANKGDSYDNAEVAGSDDFLANEDDPDAKIVWTGRVSMETTEWESTSSDLKRLMSEYGVQIMDSSVSGGNEYYTVDKGTRTRYTARTARYVLRVPSDAFNDFMSALNNAVGSVTSSDISRADMTQSYNENALALEIWQEEYNALAGLLAQATDINDILSIRDRMTSAAQQIKILSDRNSTIDYDVAWSKVSLNIREVVAYTDPDATGNVFVRMGKAFMNGLDSFGMFIGDLFVWVAGHVFYLVFWVAVIGIAVWLCVRQGKKRAKKVRIQTYPSVNDKPSDDGKNENGGSGNE